MDSEVQVIDIELTVRIVGKLVDTEREFLKSGLLEILQMIKDGIYMKKGNKEAGVQLKDMSIEISLWKKRVV